MKELVLKLPWAHLQLGFKVRDLLSELVDACRFLKLLFLTQGSTTPWDLALNKVSFFVLSRQIHILIIYLVANKMVLLTN